MAITNGYGTLEGYKQRFYANADTTDTTDDAWLEPVIESVSRLIDEICERRFYAEDETRYYTAEDPETLFIDDLLTVSALKTDHDGDRTYETTWDTGDYDLMPFNSDADTYNVKPYTWIETQPLGSYVFPVIRQGVEIAGSFGYRDGTPLPIAEACYLGAHRIMKRHDTPLGVSAAAALGEIQVKVPELRKDPDFMAFLQPFKRKV